MRLAIECLVILYRSICRPLSRRSARDGRKLVGSRETDVRDFAACGELGSMRIDISMRSRAEDTQRPCQDRRLQVTQWLHLGVGGCYLCGLMQGEWTTAW